MNISIQCGPDPCCTIQLPPGEKEMIWKGFENGAFAPPVDWTDMNSSDHFVQFYETDAYLVNSIAEYFVHGLRNGESCIMVATPDHNSGVKQLLKQFRVDLSLAIEDRHLIVLDAAETLERLMTDGRPDAKKFKHLIGRLVAEAAERTSRVRIFGEMVALLSLAGKSEAAHELEQLWNKLAQEHTFTLFCAYPLSAFDKKGSNGHMRNACSTHTRVVPAESYTSLTSPDERLRAIALLQQRARELEAEIAQLRQNIAIRDPLAIVG